MFIFENQEDKLPENTMKLLEALAADVDIDGMSESDIDIMVESAMGEHTGIINEQRNIVRINKQARIKGLTITSALAIARTKGDPLYKKWELHQKKARHYRSLIIKKYQSKSTQRAKQILSGKAKNLVDL